MNERQRPGGLTALAVLNFVFGGVGLIGALAAAVFLPMAMKATEAASEHVDEKGRAAIDAIREAGSVYFVTLLLGLVCSALLIAAGVGYLKQRPWGRTLGMVYGILGIVSSLVTASMMPKILGGGFGLGVMIGLVYPVLTLVLLNTTFREDFHR